MAQTIPFQAFFEQLAANVRFADVLDVLFIALLLYCGLAWFRHRAARSVVVVISATLLVYLIARWLEMYLTKLLFQGGFVILIIVLVIIFQQDIRRGFERIASAGMFRSGRRVHPHAELIDTIVEAAVLLAESRTGALLVLEGREPLEHHIRGGIPLEGKISVPLLQSIFHPQSVGHDGAVLIHGDRIEKFAVHLPLSKNMEQLGNRGTRHAAALGLAEFSDALIIVVSEEQGTISLAEQSRLRRTDATKLTGILLQHYRNREPARRRRPWYSGILNQLPLKLLSLAFAVTLWLLIAYRVEPLRRTYIVPIEYRNLPASWIVEEPRPSNVSVTLSGSERAFDVLEASSLRVSIDLANIRSEQTYEFPTRNSLNKLPAEVSVSDIDPKLIRVRVRREADPPNEPSPSVDADGE